MAEEAALAVILVLVEYLLQTALAQVVQEALVAVVDILSIPVEHLKGPVVVAVSGYWVLALQALVGVLVVGAEEGDLAGQMALQHHPEPAEMAVIMAAEVVGIFRLVLLVLIMALLAGEQFVLSGPVLLAHSLQLVQGICNGAIYSNPRWSAI